MPANPIIFTGGIFDHATRQPIEGATVIVHRLRRRRIKSTFADTEHVTDAGGVFSFELPAEQVEADVYLELDVRHPSYASVNGHGYGLSLIQRDLELGTAPWFKHIELFPGEEVTGVIADDENQPLAGVPIKYYSVGGPLDRRFVSDEVSIGHTPTDAAGRFRFNAICGSLLNDFWAEPEDRAVLHHPVRDQRGDLGTFRLEGGVKVNGTVLDVAGNPVAHAALALESIERHEVMWEISRRQTVADASGRFEFAPVKPGAYEVKVSGVETPTSAQDNAEPARLPGAFVPTPLTVAYLDYNRFPPVEVRAVPHVIVRVQYIDSRGNPTRGHAVHLVGKRPDGAHHSVRGPIDPHGTIEILAPRGMTDVKLLAGTDTFSALRYRRGAAGDLRDASEIPLGMLDGDVTDLFIVRFAAPTLIVRAVARDGQPASDDWRPRVDYPPGTVTNGGRWRNDIRGDVFFHRQDDGSWRSSQLLPDIDFTVTAEAAGKSSVPQTLKMNEGETREVALKLAPAAPK